MEAYQNTGRDTVEDTDGKQRSLSVGCETVVNTHTDGNTDGGNDLRVANEELRTVSRGMSEAHKAYDESSPHEPRLPSLGEGQQRNPSTETVMEENNVRAFLMPTTRLVLTQDLRRIGGRR